MKKYLLTAALFIATTPAHAVDWRSACETISKIAKRSMVYRQYGLAMSQAINDAEGDKVTEDIVIKAYNKPRYESIDQRQRAIEDFGDDEYRSCVSTLRPAFEENP